MICSDTVDEIIVQPLGVISSEKNIRTSAGDNGALIVILPDQPSPEPWITVFSSRISELSGRGISESK